MLEASEAVAFLPSHDLGRSEQFFRGCWACPSSPSRPSLTCLRAEQQRCVSPRSTSSDHSPSLCSAGSCHLRLAVSELRSRGAEFLRVRGPRPGRSGRLDDAERRPRRLVPGPRLKRSFAHRTPVLTERQLVVAAPGPRRLGQPLRRWHRHCRDSWSTRCPCRAGAAIPGSVLKFARPSRDPDDGDAQEGTGNGVADREPDSRQDEPDDIADH